MLTVPFTLSVTPRRRTVVFGEPSWADRAPIDVCYLLDDPQPVLGENSGRYMQSGKLYARRGVDLADGDLVSLPEGTFGVIGGPQLDFVHPMTGYDFGWARFHIRLGG